MRVAAQPLQPFLMMQDTPLMEPAVGAILLVVAQMFAPKPPTVPPGGRLCHVCKTSTAQSVLENFPATSNVEQVCQKWRPELRSTGYLVSTSDKVLDIHRHRGRGAASKEAANMNAKTKTNSFQHW